MAHCILPPNFKLLPDFQTKSSSLMPIKENFKLTGKMQNLVEHGHFFNNDLLHDIVHHTTQFQANIWNPKRVRVVASVWNMVQVYHGKFLCFCGIHKKSLSIVFLIVSCFMVLCITAPHVRLITEILKELEWLHVNIVSQTWSKPIMEHFPGTAIIGCAVHFKAHSASWYCHSITPPNWRPISKFLKSSNINQDLRQTNRRIDAWNDNNKTNSTSGRGV